MAITVNTHVPSTPSRYDPENEANFRRAVQSALASLQTGVSQSVAAASLPNSGVTAGTYGSGTQTPVIAVDAQGIITSASNVASGGGGGAVSSVFTRTGAVVATSGDYSVGQVTGAAPLANPAFTGNPTAPTQGAGDNSTRLATTAYADGTFAPLASPSLTGFPTAPTQSAADNSTDLATTAFVHTAVGALGTGPFLPLGGGTMTGVVTLDGAQYHVTLVNDVGYTANSNDQIIAYTALTAGRQITLPSAASNVGQRIDVWDLTGNPTVNTISVTASSGTDKLNGVTNGSSTIVGVPYGMGTVTAPESGQWIMQSAPMTTLANAGGNTISVAAKYKFNAQQEFAASTIIDQQLSLANTATTISSTTTLTAASPMFQMLTASGGDQIVKFPSSGGTWFCIFNVGSSNNIILETNTSAVVGVVPPGRWAMVYFPNTTPFYELWSSNCYTPTWGAPVNLATQGAAITATSLFTVPANAAGCYRVDWNAIVTQAATASSTLGGTGGFQVTYTDNDTGASTTPLAVPNALATGNTVGTQISGSVFVNAKASTALQYAFGYTSTGATVMQYALHIRSEFLG